jgi:hypothetical protein
MEYAEERSYTMPGTALVALERDEGLRAGGLRVSARMEDAGDDALAGTTPLQPTQLMPEPDFVAPEVRPAAKGRARVELQGASCFLDRDVASLGRGLDNDVVVEDPRVSRHHARLQRGPRGWELADLASTNGTFINGKQIRQRAITSGDSISLGGLELTFYLDSPKR